MSLSTRVLTALALGIGAGLFFGETMSMFDWVGQAFIRLLQMTVLPYVTVSLIAALGQLSYSQARNLLFRAGGVLLGIWIVSLALVLLFQFAFPEWTSASFFSSALLAEPEPLDFLSLYIPANPFHALANTVVPAVVLFSVALGVALIGVEEKAGLLATLNAIADALMRVTEFVVSLAPFGVFAITASAFGTMGLEEFGRIQIYVLTHAVLSLLLAFWLLPGLVTALTSLGYRTLVSSIWDALVTAFATGSLLIVLPILAQHSKTLLGHALGPGPEAREAEASSDVIVPASFNFPSAGKLLSLGFIPFAGWFVGASLEPSDYPGLLASGLVSFFGQVYVAMPFLLDMFRIPADMFQLYVTVDVFSSRFGTLVAAMHTVVLALLGSAAMVGRISFRAGPLIRYAAISVLLIAAAIGGLRLFFQTTVQNEYDKDKVVAGMHLLRAHVPAIVHDDILGAADPSQQGRPHLERINERGSIRVGFIPSNLPYSYVNAKGDLVGFDIEMAHTLAMDLGVLVEFVPLPRGVADFAAALDADCCDIVMTGYVVSVDRAERVIFSNAYMEETLAFLVRDDLRDEFRHIASIRALDEVRIGVPDIPYYIAKLERILPNVEVELLPALGDFFEPAYEHLDALLITAERGSALALFNPQYTVAVPEEARIKVPVAYVVPHGDPGLLAFVNSWIELKQRDGTFDSAYAYWILGRDAVAKPPRWSVIRNVLGWVD